MSLSSSPRTARSHTSLFIQSMDIKTLHYQTSATVTFGLRWPWCGEWSGQRGRGRVACRSFVFLLLGDVAQMWQRPCSASRFLMRQARAQTPTRKHIWMKKRRPWQVKPSHVPFPHGIPVNYWPAPLPPARHEPGGLAGSKVGLFIVRKVELITAHNPFVLLHVICLLSK